MKAILVNEDKSLRWDNVPDPIIKDDEGCALLGDGGYAEYVTVDMIC